MQKKSFPFGTLRLQSLVTEYGTPFHLYDESGIRNNLQSLKSAFSKVPGFKEYYAVKACPNPYILDVLKDEGCGMDCSSLWELILSEAIGLKGEDIMFTSNNTSVKEFQKAKELWAIINFDDITHIDYYLENVGELPELICFRYNPGPLKGWNVIIGAPEGAKFWLTREQIFEAYERCRDLWVKRFGIHTMVASNELQTDYFLETAKILFELTRDIEQKLDIEFDFINLGGGIGVAYKPEETPVDFEELAVWMKELYNTYFSEREDSLSIVIECGRMVTGPYGYLVTSAIHKKNIYKDYIWLDTCMSDLMRPWMYWSYHYISVLGKQDEVRDHMYDIVGSLCENNDKFAIDRELPEITIWDTIVIHDTWAHGYSMWFNYNAKLKSREILLLSDGSSKVIRRAETFDDYFATLDYKGL